MRHARVVVTAEAFRIVVLSKMEEEGDTNECTIVGNIKRNATSDNFDDCHGTRLLGFQNLGRRWFWHAQTISTIAGVNLP